MDVMRDYSRNAAWWAKAHPTGLLHLDGGSQRLIQNHVDIATQLLWIDRWSAFRSGDQLSGGKTAPGGSPWRTRSSICPPWFRNSLTVTAESAFMIFHPMSHA
jgi:hypothetical protein